MTTPAENEITAPGTIEIEWKDRTWSVPASLDDAPIEVMEAIEDGKGYRAAAAILGTAQWADIKATLRPTKRDVDELMGVISRALGFGDAGE